jgi:hypothetical protein
MPLMCCIRHGSGQQRVVPAGGPRQRGDRVEQAGAFVVALLGFLALLALGVIRRWRWLFWVILVAVAAGVLRVPIAVVQSSGRMSPGGPNWYVAVQGVIGVIQVCIAVAMFIGYCRAGPWGPY